MKLFNRFLTIILSVGFIPVLPVFIFLIYYQINGKESILKYHQNIASVSARMSEESLYQLSMRISNYGGFQIKQEDISVLAVKRNPDIMFAALLDEKGRQINSYGAVFAKKLFDYIDISSTDFFAKIKKSGQPVIGEFKLLGDMPTAVVVYPLENGKFIYAAVNLKELFSGIYEQKIGKTGGIHFASSSGNIFSMNSFSLQINPSKMEEILSSREGYFTSLSDKNQSYVGAFAEIGDLNLYVVTLQNSSEAFRETNLATSSLLFMILSLLTVFYFIAMVTARNIAMPINRLIDASERVSRNDFSRLVKPDPRIKEVNTLINSFNLMMKAVGKYQSVQLEKILGEKEKLELLTGLINDGIILSDFSGNIVYANLPAQEIIRFKKDPALAVFELVKIASSAKGKPLDIDWISGKKFLISIKVSNPAHDAPLVFIVLRDITAEFRIQSVKEDFFRAVAHDVRAPLLNMQGYIKLLAFDEEDKEKKKHYIKGLEEESERIFKLVESVLDMARLEGGAIRLEKEEISFCGFLSALTQRFSAVFKLKNISCVLDCSADMKIEADRSLLERAVDNIVSNAYRFSLENGKIFISVAKDKEGVILSVRDEGPGIAKERLNKIFDKFTGYDSSGFGLGLSITKAIVELHGGSVWAESDGSNGSVFKISLPEIKAKKS